MAALTAFITSVASTDMLETLHITADLQHEAYLEVVSAFIVVIACCIILSLGRQPVTPLYNTVCPVDTSYAEQALLQNKRLELPSSILITSSGNERRHSSTYRRRQCAGMLSATRQPIRRFISNSQCKRHSHPNTCASTVPLCGKRELDGRHPERDPWRLLAPGSLQPVWIR